MAGLAVASLLAKSGRRVLVLEAHDQPGGYAHTFTMKDYKFCAQVHYVFNCGEGESIHRLLTQLGLVDHVPFVRLDPEGFDHVVVAGERTRIPNGWRKFENRLVQRYPDAAGPLRRYFDVIATLGSELDRMQLPDRALSVAGVRAAFGARHVLYYLRWTLQELYDHVHMPLHLQAILAGQSGDYLLPPRDVSLLLHVSLVTLYDRGAYYPKHHYVQFVEALADSIRNAPGCALLLEHEVERIHVERGKVTGVRCKNGVQFTADRYVSNADPRVTARAGRGSVAERAHGLRVLVRHRHAVPRHPRSRPARARLRVVQRLALPSRPTSIASTTASCSRTTSPTRGCSCRRPRCTRTSPACVHPAIRSWRSPPRATSRSSPRCERPTAARTTSRRNRCASSCSTSSRRATYPSFATTWSCGSRAPPPPTSASAGLPKATRTAPVSTRRTSGPGRGSYRSDLDNLWLANATAGFPSVAGAAAAGMHLFELLS